MIINTVKSKSMLIGSYRKIKNLDSGLNVLFDDKEIVNVKYEKLLGITIDDCLSWSTQISNLASKISSRIGLMCRLKEYLPKEGLLIYYNAYILPLFDYCCTIWGETSSANMDKLYKLQKRAARIILNAKYDVPSLVLFKKLGWLTIQNRIDYHRGVLMFKCVNNNAPEYLCNLFTTSSAGYSLRSVTNGNLFVPRPNSNFMKKTFHYLGAVLWNVLPSNLKSIKKIDLSKSKYMDFLLLKPEND